MNTFEKPFQQIEILNKRVSFLEKKVVNDNQNSFEFVIEDFVKETIMPSSKKNSIYFDKKLKRGGIYSKFLQFYFLHYSNTRVNLNQKNIITEFENSLVNIFSYDLTKNVVVHSNTFRDTSYKYLEFKNLILFTDNNISLKLIMDAFITESIESSSDYNEIIFDKKLQLYGIFPRFLQFYFLKYSFVSINLNSTNILEYFNSSLVSTFSYDIQNNCVIKKNSERDIVYKDLQFKKF
jgi:hypothetical protein